MEQEKLARIRERKARYQRNWRKKRKLQGLADMDGALDLEEVAAEGRGTSEEDYGAYHAPRESDSDIAEVDYDLLECTAALDREILRDSAEEGEILHEELTASPVVHAANVDAEIAELGEGAEDVLAEQVAGGEQDLHHLEGGGQQLQQAEEPGGGDAVLDAWQYREEELRDGDDVGFRATLGMFIAQMTAAGSCTKVAAQNMLQFFAANAENIVRLKRRMVSIKSLNWLLESTFARVAPNTTTEFFSLDKETQLQTCIGQGSLFTKKLQEEETVKRASHVPLLSILQHIYRLHNVSLENPPQEWRVLDFASDGVTMTNYGSWSYHVASISLPMCGKPYPYYIHQLDKSNGGEMKVHHLLTPFVEELKALPFVVDLRWTIGDAKERKFTKGLTATNSKFGCEFCLIRGGRVQGDHKARTSFPPPEVEPQARTTEGCKRAMGKQNMRFIAEGSRDDFKWRRQQGYAVFSPLLSLLGFDMILKGPIDSMHLLALGMSKKIFNLTIGSEKDLLRAFNSLIKSVRVPSEMGRRTRAFIKRYKASEWQLVGKFCFPWMILSGMCESLTGTERKIMLIFCFMYRALELNERDFAIVEERIDLQGLLRTMEGLYTAAFGRGEHTFNDHNYFRHLLETRRRCGPLSQYASWKYESMFSYLKKCFRAGTRHEGKQMLQRFYARDRLGHNCHGVKRLQLSKKASGKSNDNIICTREGFFKIVRKPTDNGTLLCKPIATTRMNTAEDGLEELDWDLVGARVLSARQDLQRVRRIRREDITGKGVVVGETILECKSEWLVE